MKKILSGAIDGMRTGSLVYLLVKAFDIQPSPPTASNIYSVIVMSALIGIVTLIFELEDFSRLTLFIIHFFLTAILTCGMMIYNGWLSILMKFEFWFSFVLIYILVWFLVNISNYLKTQKINRALHERRKKNNNRP